MGFHELYKFIQKQVPVLDTSNSFWYLAVCLLLVVRTSDLDIVIRCQYFLVINIGAGESKKPFPALIDVTMYLSLLPLISEGFHGRDRQLAIYTLEERL